MQCPESILAALHEGWQMEISLFDALCQPDSYHQLSGASPAKKIAFLCPILQFALGSVHEFLIKMKAETRQRAAKKVFASLS
jgi:hypothetical protein